MRLNCETDTVAMTGGLFASIFQNRPAMTNRFRTRRQAAASPADTLIGNLGFVPAEGAAGSDAGSGLSVIGARLLEASCDDDDDQVQAESEGNDEVDRYTGSQGRIFVVAEEVC